MIEIESKAQLNKIPDNDFVLLIKKPRSKNKLHKATCYSLSIFRDMMMKDQGKEIIATHPNLGHPFPRNAKYYHIKSDEIDILEKYKDNECSKCFDND